MTTKDEDARGRWNHATVEEQMERLGANGGPAFPQTIKNQGGPDLIATGLSVRDWFAGQALAGYRAISADLPFSTAARLSYEDADAMLAERRKGSK